MAYGEQYIPCSTCSIKRGTCKMCERRIARERDLQRRIDRMHKHFEERNPQLFERQAQ